MNIRKNLQIKQVFFGKLFRKKTKEENVDFLKKEKDKLNDLTPETILIGIEGRGSKKEPKIDFGYGEACVFLPDEVKDIADSFCTCDTFREKPDYKKLDDNQVFPEYWQQEGDDLFDNYIVANFDKLKSLYTAASSNNEVVVMWYS